MSSLVATIATGGANNLIALSAHRWTKSHVFVRFQDARSATGFVWVRARGVRRA